jgi:hypothetical protein
MSNPTSTEWSSEIRENGYCRRLGQLLVKGLSIALLAGMGAFVYNATQFVPGETDVRLLLVPVFAAGAFAYLFADSLRASARLGLIGFFGGLVVFMGAWIAPLWILPYSPTARDILLPKMLGEGGMAFIACSAAYLAGYLSTVSIAAFWE